MANRLWTSGGKIVVDGSGKPILSPVCPCDVPCDYRCHYCCDPELAAQYTVTLSGGFTLATTCAGDITFTGPYTVDYLGWADTDDCWWTSDTTDEGGGYYSGVILQYDWGAGWIYVSFIVSDSPDLAAFGTDRTCCASYPYECAAPVVVTKACVAQFDNSASGPHYCATAFGRTVPWSLNAQSGCGATCSGGSGKTVTLS